MLKDRERYIFTTEKPSVMRDVLSHVFAAVNSEGDAAPEANPRLEAFTNTGCDRMILELRRPKEGPVAVFPTVTNLRVSRLGRVLVVTGDATNSGVFQDIEAMRRQHFFPGSLASSLAEPVRMFFRTLHLADNR